MLLTEKMLCFSCAVVEQHCEKWSPQAQVFADQTLNMSGVCSCVWVKAQPHTHVEEPRAQWRNVKCGILRNETKADENPNSEPSQISCFCCIY